MNDTAGGSYTMVTEFIHIDNALKSRWGNFLQIEEDFRNFSPRKIEDFSAYRDAELERLQKINPDVVPSELLELIDNQIRLKADPEWQVTMEFLDEIMSEYVIIAFLSHALTEALINAILAIGLSQSGSPELFSLLERADIKEKWVAAPKTFFPTYQLPRDRILYQTLQHLTRQRNAFIHYKTAVEIDGEIKIEGTKLDHSPLSAQLQWIRRYFNLPYDLAAHARSQMPRLVPLILFDRAPIQLMA